MAQAIKKPAQTMLYSDDEIALIKGIFAGNDELPIMIRKAIIQWPLLDSEIKILRSTFQQGCDALKLLKKVLIPEVDGDAPLFQLVDLWATLKLNDMDLGQQVRAVRSRGIAIDYIKRQFAHFFDGATDVPFPIVGLIPTPQTAEEDAVVNLGARNTIISHTDFQMNRLKVLAGVKEESVEDAKKRLERDSNK